MTRRRFALAALALTLVVMELPVAAPFGTGGPDVARAAEPADPGAAALAHLVEHATDLGLTPDDVRGAVVTDVVPSVQDTTTVYVQQRHDGLDVHGAIASVTLDATHRPVASTSTFVAGVARQMPPTLPRTSVFDASVAAASALGLAPSEPFVARSAMVGRSLATLISDGGISKSDIPVRLVLQPLDDGSVALAWELTIDELDGTDWWQVRVDAATGMELDRNNLVARDSYRVHAPPVEAPSFGTRTLEVDPADPAASPFGWHDTDGVAGAESTLTEGNNVIAYVDAVPPTNVPDPGSKPDGGASLVFDFPVDLLQDPATYADALVTNLFYWNNLAHDVFHAYGFDEPSGNFQTNNYGNGGLGGDPVLAEALDGSDTDNANFATPPDGTSPRMQMFRWTAPDPDREASFDSSVVIHEYAHGVTNRLTGGPSNVFCLSAAEAPGEGWSDFFGLMFTIEPGDAGTDARGFGTWLLDQPTTGPGLRDFRYSTDLVTDPRTYDEIKTATGAHDTGSTFAAMLWELAWALIDRDGFDPDLAHGTGGNNTAMQLVVDALKLQPCNPGFVDARDAILTADQLGFAGANECLIWRAFAKRGLGHSAKQGSSNSRADGVEAFDLPPHCRDLQVTTIAPDLTSPGTIHEHTVITRNNSVSPITGVTVTDVIPTGYAYLDGSGECGAVFATGTLTLDVGSLDPGEQRACTFDVRVTETGTTQVLLEDDFESGTGNWSATMGAGALTWAESLVDPHSPSTSMFASNPASTSDQYLTTAVSHPVTATTMLRFWHRYDTEPQWDGGVVEASVDGVAWADLGSSFVQNGYDEVLLASSNPLAGRAAFSGSSNGYVESVVDLSNFAGSNVYLRFRLGTDGLIGADGWHVDDVRIADVVGITDTVTATSNETDPDQHAATTEVVAHGLLRITTAPPLPSQIVLDGRPLDRWGIDWMKLAPGIYEVCFTDVAGWTTPPCADVEVQPGQTATHAGTFTQNGFVRVVTDPPVPATITVDGVPSDDWEVWVDMAPGLHTICFGAVADHLTPDCEEVTVTAGGPLQTITGTYVPSLGAPGPTGHGLLRVSTTTGVPTTVIVDGIVRDTWALNWLKLAPGDYEVCYTDVVDHETPPCETVAVAADQTTVVDAVFVARGILRVVTDLPHPSTIYVDGHPRDDWGIWTDVPAGPVQVCFGEDAGHIPPCETVTLTPLTTSTVTGTWP